MTAGSTYHLEGFLATDHVFTVALDPAEPDGRRLQVYGREVRRPDRTERPWLVFLQGGPGGKSPRPTDLSGWVRAATAEFRVLLLDQRGTGRSTPANHRGLAQLGSTAQAEYLSHFRADAIVADCETIRRELVGPDGRWSVLGQSFGGFCATTYLSHAPQGLDRVFITGGLPPLGATPDDVYRVTYSKMLRRNETYHERFPGDEAELARIRDHLVSTEIRLPRGDLLRPERLQYLGLKMGMVGGFEEIHYLVEEAWARPGVLSDTFLIGVEEATSLAVNPLFAVLHEAAYCEAAASRWSADRIRAEFPEFSAEADRFLFTGEMIYPWMFDGYADLRPLHDAAHLLAEKADWPSLYDPDRLATNEVPVAAVVYYDDMYVSRELSMPCAEAIRGIRTWITNEYEHDGLRRDGERVLGRLRALADG